MRCSSDHQDPPPLRFDPHGIDEATQLSLLERMLLPRLIEEKSLRLLRQGRISKWFSGIGQEAVSVGLTSALDADDYVLPLHRNLGVFTTRELPLTRLFAQWQGKAEGYTQGRDRSFHFGAVEHRVVGMISHLGAMLGVADGLALASRLDGTRAIAAVFSGDGGTSQGDFHEAVNLAAVWDLPVLFVIENNGYGLSTPSESQYRCRHFVDKAVGYGIEGHRIDGNDVFDVYRTTRDLAASIREKPRPILLEALTFRMRGHEEASGTRYVPDVLLARWQERDPVVALENDLRRRGVVSAQNVKRMRLSLAERIEQAWSEAFELPDLEVSSARELADVYAVGDQDPNSSFGTGPGRSIGGDSRPESNTAGTSLRFVDAIASGLKQGLERDEGLVLMGQDVADYGGVFKVSAGLLERFGSERIRNTPLCESAVLGCALGLAIAGRASVVEMQFADFVSCGFNQIVNNLAKTHYRWGQPVNVTIRMPTGAGVAAGPFHSQSTEAWFAHVPGLKIVYPSSPSDAKGLLLSSLREPNPVMFFEHKMLYRSVEDVVSDDAFEIPLGRARVAQEGERLTVVAYGAAVYWAEREAEKRDGIEVIDLRTLVPWDREAVYRSVRKTSRCLVVHEDTAFAGIGAEIAADVGATLFDALDAPVVRVGALDTPVPFAKPLEANFLPQRRLSDAIDQLLAY